MGSFDLYSILIRNESSEKAPYNTNNLVISNDQTGTLYMIIFEAPASQWEPSWKKGKVILSHLFFDADI